MTLLNEEVYEEEVLCISYVNSLTDEMRMIQKILEKREPVSYRKVRSQLTNKGISLKDSRYHVLEQLYSF